MSPEVVRRRPTDKRLDVFSVGATAYHLCALTQPWPSPDAEKAALAAMAHDTIAPRDLRDLCPDLNADLAAAIMQCLERDPKDRPQSMGDFLHEIRDVQREDV